MTWHFAALVGLFIVLVTFYCLAIRPVHRDLERQIDELGKGSARWRD